MNNENITATSTKRVRADGDTSMPLAPVLKITRAEAKSTNFSRVNWLLINNSKN